MGKITKKQFVEKVNNKFGDIYTIVGEYVNTSIKIKVKHNVCDYEWDIFPSNLMNCSGSCPKCSDKIHYTTETFNKYVQDITNGDYTVVGGYKNAYTKITMKHLICGYAWEVKPKYFKNDATRCPRCQKRERYTDEDFKNKVEELTCGEITPLDSYKNNYTKIRFKHLVCGAIFKEQPTRIINEFKDCPECHIPLSKGEKKIANFLNEKEIKYETQFTFDDCKDVKLLRFDFAIKQDNNLISLIEFDGGQHFKPVEFFGGEEGFLNSVRRDQIKNEYCKKNNIPLLRIPYWDYVNIETIIDDFLKNNQY